MKSNKRNTIPVAHKLAVHVRLKGGFAHDLCDKYHCHYDLKLKPLGYHVCLFDLILYVSSTIFQ